MKRLLNNERVGESSFQAMKKWVNGAFDVFEEQKHNKAEKQ